MEEGSVSHSFLSFTGASPVRALDPTAPDVVSFVPNDKGSVSFHTVDNMLFDFLHLYQNKTFSNNLPNGIEAQFL